MSKSKAVILAIDDEKDILDTIKAILKGRHDVIAFQDPEKALEHIRSHNIDIVLLDIKMPVINGLEVLKNIKAFSSSSEVIMISALTDSVTAVSAMKLGAYDYINKPFDKDELVIVIEKALERISLLDTNSAYKEMLEKTTAIIGRSKQMNDLLADVTKIAPCDTSVLITGETGTGKEVIAKMIHKNSLRAKNAFIAVNCAAIPDTLFESELFGSERGAYTGSVERRIGKFESADGGTLFLDEIGCLSMSMQAKLLRVLQEGELTRLGGNDQVKVNFRLICATNSDLLNMSKKGSFREDLFYRINVVPINIAPLRDRGQDILLLSKHYLALFSNKFNKKISGFTKEAEMSLISYGWPGNVRELENMVQRAVVMSDRDIISEVDLPDHIRYKGSGILEPLSKSVDLFEVSCIEKALVHTGRNQSKAAELLRIDRSTLISKMRKYGIN